jgi:hypothetical protein
MISSASFSQTILNTSALPPKTVLIVDHDPINLQLVPTIARPVYARPAGQPGFPAEASCIGKSFTVSRLSQSAAAALHPCAMIAATYRLLLIKFKKENKCSSSTCL